MKKADRIALIDATINLLHHDRESELDSIPADVTGENYDAAEKAIFDRYQPKINRLFVERIAAAMPAPKNQWFLGAMAWYIAKADENGGKGVFQISARQKETFCRYASGIVDDGRHGRYPSVVTGADVDGHLIKITSSGCLIVEKY